MTVRVDLDRKTICASVKDLAAAPEPAGHIESGGAALTRAKLGREAHSTYQRDASERRRSYAKEFTVSCEMAVDDFTAKIGGRIDGVYERRGGLIVEEIKSVFSPAESEARVKERGYGATVRQIQIYVFFLSRMSGKAVSGRLVFVGLADGTRREVAVPYAEEAVENYVVDRLRGFIAQAREESARLKVRRGVAEAVRFPFAATRRHQDEMIEAVTATLKARQPLLVSAPTGIGKTVAVLYPALKWALENDLRLFFVTSKTTQQRLVMDTLRQMVDPQDGVAALLLRAKEKMCANSEYVCHPDFCPYARDYYTRLGRSTALSDLLRFGIIAPEAVYERALAEGLCPFELSLDLALHVDVVIGDYNYVFDPTVYLRRFFLDGKYDDIILIIDEAHNLYQRGREYYSPALARTALDAAAASVADGSVPTRAALGLFYMEIADALDTLRQQVPEDAPESKAIVSLDDGWFADRRDALETLMAAYYVHRRETGGSLADDPVESFARDFIAFTNVLALGGDEFDPIFERRAEGDVLRILCKDPSRQLGRRLKGFYTTVAMSATLEPMGFYRDVLGFDRDATRLVSLPSPFPDAHRLIVVVPEVSTTYTVRRRYHGDIAAVVQDIVAARPGNYFVFFPSFEYLNDVRPHFANAPFEVLWQEPQMRDRDRDRIFEALQEPRGRKVVLAVQGGIFAEGVDYPGEMLIGVIVIGPGLPRVTFEQELLRRYYEERYGAGFEYAYLYVGMNRVIQSAGRLIRSEEDRGVIALVCRRFATPTYANLFPRHWYDETPEELLARDWRRAIAEFWQRQDADAERHAEPADNNPQG